MQKTQPSAKPNLGGVTRHDAVDRQGDPAEPALRSLLILSDIRFFREGLAQIFEQNGVFRLVGLAADVGEAALFATDVKPEIILVDASLPDGLGAVAHLHGLAPLCQIVALALAETEIAVVAWAEAGVCGYVPRGTSLDELISLLEGIVRGEQICSRKIAASLPPVG